GPDRTESIVPGSRSTRMFLDCTIVQMKPSPVTLDPNTAHPCLILSENLTSLKYSKQPCCCPDNPERFHMSAEVVAMTPLGSGSHHWVVETGSNQDWLLGVASMSVPRNAEISARPENGFWTLCFRDGEFRAMTSPPTPLTLSRTPKQIKVQLDYNKGTVSFFDPADNSVICAFTHSFTEIRFSLEMTDLINCVFLQAYLLKMK
uniref:B30.2/SPRY domain-containing protein n=1 Tax=Seriola dumerili TaxID=41447 RepID=A0A3B4UR30_SERDU